MCLKKTTAVKVYLPRSSLAIGNLIVVHSSKRTEKKTSLDLGNQQPISNGHCVQFQKQNPGVGF